MNPKHPPGPPMTLGSMYEHGVHHLIGFCHNDALVPAAGQVRQVRRQARRCAAELEGSAGLAGRLARALGLGKVMASWQSDLAAATEAAYI